MGKCPVCKEKIDFMYLERCVAARVTMSFNVSSDMELTRMPESEGEPDLRDTLLETYYCPKCNSEIAESFDEARKIMSEE